MSQKVLIIEDEPAILLGLKDELSQEYETYTASDGTEGLRLAQKVQPDIILLDLLLPDIDGLAVCQQVREKGIDTGVIMVTARDQVVDKIKGLEAGADDYITKPFSLDELKARVKAVLRRKELAPAQSYKDDILSIDFKTYKATKKTRLLKLSSLEFKLLRFLISHKGKVVSRQEVLEQVWGYEVTPSTRTVDAHIVSLRKKIGKKYLATIHGQGYRFECISSGSAGMALLMVLLTTILITGLIATGFIAMNSNYGLTLYLTDGVKSFYLADAGIKRAMHKIENDDFADETWSFAGEDVEITIDDLGGNIYEVFSTNTYGNLNADRIIRAKIKKDTPARLLEWRKLQ